MARVALDAMGGDRAPAETVAGAVDASRTGHEIVLVGREPELVDLLAEHGEDLPIVHAPEVIGMSDEPARAIRERRDASIVVATKLVRSGEAEAVVSAGSTGAAMAAAALLLGRIKGVNRPAIASVMPVIDSPTVLLDSGANPDCSASQLAQFGVMGAVLAEVYLGVPDPRVGLLNIGEEPSKGRDLQRAAHALLEAGPTNFIGNVEGHDVVGGKADVIVADGFAGNIALKTSEGTARYVGRVVLDALATLPPDNLANVLPVMDSIREQMDYETFGGAHLVGTNGVVVIAHGSSSRKAISNALAIADDGARRGIVDLITKQLSQLG